MSGQTANPARSAAGHNRKYGCRTSGAREFRVLAPGEPFFFKTHYPHNKLVGGGFFSDSARLRVSEAWEFFDEANGVASVAEMRARIGRYRRVPIGVGEDPVIGG
jgi:putative restriction endonuclease